MGNKSMSKSDLFENAFVKSLENLDFFSRNNLWNSQQIFCSIMHLRAENERSTAEKSRGFLTHPL